MSSDYLHVILGRIEMTADSISAAVVARNNVFYLYLVILVSLKKR